MARAVAAWPQLIKLAADEVTVSSTAHDRKHGESTWLSLRPTSFYGPIHWSEKVHHLQLLVKSRERHPRSLERAT